MYSKWIIGDKKLIDKYVIFVCLHHAGGSASFYSSWRNELPAEIGMLAIELPGRGSRILEAPSTDIGAIAVDLKEALLPYRRKNIVLFGHSMGAIIAMELAFLMKDHIRLVAVSGCRPIHLKEDVTSLSYRRMIARGGIPMHLLSLPQLAGELKILGGTPTEIFENTELMEICAKYIQSDYKLIHDYRSKPRPHKKISRPILVFGGEDDADVRPDDLPRWAELTTVECWVEMFPGGHFYLNSGLPQVISKILYYLAVIESSTSMDVNLNVN